MNDIVYKTEIEKEIDDLLFSKAVYELRKKEEQLQAALLRVSVLRKKISIIKKQIRKNYG